MRPRTVSVLAALAALLVASAARAQEPAIDLPKALEVEAGDAVEIKSNCKQLTWAVVPPGGLVLFREYDPDAAKVILRVLPKSRGPFTLVVCGALGDRVKMATCVLTLKGEPLPGPPGPGPQPVPPPPADPLAQKLQAAYGAAPAAEAATRDADRQRLATLYRAMVEHCDNPDSRTLADLLADLKGESSRQVPADRLVELRRAIAAEIAAALGKSPSAPLTPESRRAAADLFGRIAAALLQLK